MTEKHKSLTVFLADDTDIELDIGAIIFAIRMIRGVVDVAGTLSFQERPGRTLPGEGVPDEKY